MEDPSFRRCSDVVWRRAPGFLALSREGRDVTVVRGAAADVWELIEQETTVSAVTRALSARYGVTSEVVHGDLAPLLDVLSEQRYIVARP